MRNKTKPRRSCGHNCTSVSTDGSAADRVAALVRSDPRLGRASDLAADAARACPRHGPDCVVEIPTQAVPGFSRLSCSRCKLKLGIRPATEAGVRHWANNYTMTFGRHRGRRLSDLVASPTTFSYVTWAATLDNDAAVAARIVLSGREVSRQ